MKNDEERIQHYTYSLNKLDELLDNTSHEYNSNISHSKIYEELFNKRAECYMNSKKYHEAVKDYEILVNFESNCKYIL